ncbi:MAG: right-handed parallel beta-helix repeat-containing protein [Pseudomonadota bacterium]
MLPVEQPFKIYTGRDGQPLQNGYIYFGIANQNPLTAPVTVYWDAAGTQPALQPLRTENGYIVRAGTPANVFVSGTYSEIVQDSRQRQVFYARTSDEFSTFAAVISFAISLASSIGSSLIGFIQAGIGAVLRTLQDKARDRVHVKDFGALNNGLQASATVNRAAIQAAVDAMNLRGGGEVIIGGGGVYYVDLVNYIRDGGAVYGVTSIKMLDNVAIRIEPGTTIRLIDNAYGAGAYYRMFSSRDATRLSNSAITGGGTIDGNIANQIVNADNNASNIQLECLNNVRVDGIRSINAKGMAIQLRGALGGNAKNLFVVNNYVDNVINIGIQVSWFSGLVIEGNNVFNCTNNGIDIYGEDGTTTCQSKNFTIANNTIDTTLTGVFCETVRNGVVNGNSAVQCAIGYIVNRINGQPKGILLSNNSALTCPIGARVTGDTGGVTLSGNVFSDFSTAGVKLADGIGGNVSYVNVHDNTFIPVNNTTGIVVVQGAQASFNHVHANTVISAGIIEAYLHNDTAGISVGNVYGGFYVLPTQVGPILDDSAYGTFTPAVAGSATAGTQTYTFRNATYTRIGRIVFFRIAIALSAKDGATAGNIRITGLPFTSDVTAQTLCGAHFTQAQLVTFSAGYTQVVGTINPNTNYISVDQIGSNVVAAALPVAAFAATSTFNCSGHYFI